MEPKTRFPIIEASGTPYQIGLIHGSQGKAQVLACLETYRSMFLAFSGIPWGEAKEMALGFEEPIRRYDPGYLEEMRGIADGAGVAYTDILALNVRSELVLQGRPGPVPDGCTSVAVTPERSREGQVLLGQNWDWRASQRNAILVLKIRQQNGRPDIFLVTEGGIIGKYGFNSRGIGVCLNALAVDAPPAGLPLHIAMRGILEAQNLCEAILMATKQPLACAANFMLASAGGEAVDLEISGDDFDVLYPPEGLLVHTNHFRSLRLPPPPLRETSKGKWPDTFLRCGIAEKTLGRLDRIGLEDLKGIFAHHGDYPTSICHHEDPRDPAEKRLCTVISIIMDLTRGECHICPAQPCEEPYQVYRW